MISTCAISCINNGIDVVGIRHGYSSLIDFEDEDRAKRADTYLRSQGIVARGVGGYGLPTCLRMTIGTEEDMDFLFGALNRFLES